jgi:hypothetical protein
MRCSMCNESVRFSKMTAVGERGFCSEKCYCIYVGLPIEEEGYYGLDKNDN